MTTAYDYAPFYCEENVLRLCPSLGEGALAVLVTNRARCIEMRCQRAGGGEIVWDYHAFAIGRRDGWVVWDFDTTLGWPTPAAPYLASSFPPAAVHPPFFRLMAAGDYAREFRSDRAHMRRPDGRWSVAPPHWPPADGAGGFALLDLLDPRSRCLGEVLTLPAMRERFAG